MTATRCATQQRHALLRGAKGEDLLEPAPEDAVDAWLVSRVINHSKAPELIKPINLSANANEGFAAWMNAQIVQPHTPFDALEFLAVSSASEQITTHARQVSSLGVEHE